MSSRPANLKIAEVTTRIIKSWLDENRAGAAELGQVIRTVSDCVSNLHLLAGPRGVSPSPPLKPAVPIKKSIAGDTIVCLECGGKYHSLKRHLQTSHSITANDYIARWQLPKSYPLSTIKFSDRRRARAANTGEQ